jgi:nucleotide-binding universal stress UspA family protein
MRHLEERTVNPSSQPIPETHAGSGRSIARIAVGVDGYPEGRDAAALGELLARSSGAELMLVSVHSDPLVVLPPGLDWSGLHEQAATMVRDVRDSVAPDARVLVETDVSVPRALWRVVRREHRDLLVLGSSRLGPDGHVRIGKRTRQLLCGFECALAIAPRGFGGRGELQLRRIGVGYDGGPEAQAALGVAAALARACGAALHLQGVVDDRVRVLGWSRVGHPGGAGEWDAAVAANEQALRSELESVVESTGLEGAGAEVVRGRPADALLALATAVDLLVIGSRRWGVVARLVLGSTGEALLREAASPVLVVPRPTDPGEEERAGAT